MSLYQKKFCLWPLRQRWPFRSALPGWPRAKSDRAPGRWPGRPAGRWPGRPAGRWPGRPMARQADGQAGRWPGRPMARQAGRPMAMLAMLAMPIQLVRKPMAIGSRWHCWPSQSNSQQCQHHARSFLRGSWGWRLSAISAKPCAGICRHCWRFKHPFQVAPALLHTFHIMKYTISF